MITLTSCRCTGLNRTRSPERRGAECWHQFGNSGRAIPSRTITIQMQRDRLSYRTVSSDGQHEFQGPRVSSGRRSRFGAFPVQSNSLNNVSRHRRLASVAAPRRSRTECREVLNIIQFTLPRYEVSDRRRAERVRLRMLRGFHSQLHGLTHCINRERIRRRYRRCNMLMAGSVESGHDH